MSSFDAINKIVNTIRAQEKLAASQTNDLAVGSLTRSSIKLVKKSRAYYLHSLSCRVSINANQNDRHQIVFLFFKL